MRCVHGHLITNSGYPPYGPNACGESFLHAATTNPWVYVALLTIVLVALLAFLAGRRVERTDRLRAAG